MCGTLNDQNAQSCSFCGYLFEDYSTTNLNQPTSQQQRTPSTLPAYGDTTAPAKMPEQTPAPSQAYTSDSSGSPLFTVNRSIWGTIIPSVIYLILVSALGLFSSFSLYSIVLVVFFLLIAVVPALFSPRRFDFYEDSMKVHKTIGGDAEYPYTSVSMVEYPNMRRQTRSVVLNVTGQRGQFVLGKNPTNQQLGMDLRQFLTQKLKRNDQANPGNQNEGNPNSNDVERPSGS